MGIMMGCPQRLQGSVESGGRSPGMKTLASHPGQVTIFKLPLVLILLSTWFGRWALTHGPWWPIPPQQTSHVLAVLSRPVKAEPREIRSFG